MYEFRDTLQKPYEDFGAGLNDPTVRLGSTVYKDKDNSVPPPPPPRYIRLYTVCRAIERLLAFFLKVSVLLRA